MKLLLSNPTGDVLATPTELLPSITGTITSNDTWARLEQIKEAYEKGQEALSKAEYMDLCPKYYNPSTEVLYVNGPNVADYLRSEDLGYAASTYALLNEVHIIKKSSSLSRRWLERITANTINLTNNDAGSIYNGTALSDFVPPTTNSDRYVRINFPNATKLNNEVISDVIYTRSNWLNITILAPEVTTFSKVLVDYYSSTPSATNLPAAPKCFAYLPKANDTIWFGMNKTSTTYARAIPFQYESIKYLLDNINKAPSNGHRDYPYVALNNLRAPSSFTSGESITINYTDVNGAEQTAIISDVVVEAGERMVDAIKRKVKNTDSLKNVLDIFSTSASKFYISGPKDSIINSVESTVNLITVPSSAITPKETTAGQTLFINCGVDDALGTYVDVTDKAKGWVPTGTFGDYIGQFLLDCAGKWNIVWYPNPHA